MLFSLRDPFFGLQIDSSNSHANSKPQQLCHRWQWSLHRSVITLHCKTHTEAFQKPFSEARLRSWFLNSSPLASNALSVAVHKDEFLGPTRIVDGAAPILQVHSSDMLTLQITVHLTQVKQNMYRSNRNCAGISLQFKRDSCSAAIKEIKSLYIIGRGI